MIDKKSIFTLLLLVFCGSALLAQKYKEKVESKVPTTLDRARNLKSSDPNKAIKLIESVIESKRKKIYDPGREAEAYMLLGNIYEEIDQKKLALQRYEQARRILEKTKLMELRAQNHLAIGRLSLEGGNAKSAEQEFVKCLKFSTNKSTRLQCEIGRADVAYFKKDYEKSIAIFSTIDKGWEGFLDSISLSNVEAKKSLVFSNTEELDKAKEFYFNSLNTFPTSSYNENSFRNVELANDNILANLSNIDEKIALRRDNVKFKNQRNFSKQSIIKEQLELANLYLENGEIDEAETLILTTKSLTTNQTNQEQTAKVFKKAAEISQQRGAFDEADRNYKEYDLAIDKSNQNKRMELEKKLEILKDQAKIDILNKDIKIEEKQEELLKQQLKNQKYVTGLLGLLLLGALVSFYFIMRNVKAKRKANSLLLLKSLRTQMNPHFIFNALNSVNNYISKNDEKAANKFLANFSKLMRIVLDYSQKDFISFEEEIELIELYLKLEHARFRDKFDYVINKEEEVDYNSLDIPPMLIQPFIENAVWHGLRYKETKGQLTVDITSETDHLKIKITDNGIGREKSKALKTKNQKQYESTGLKNVDKRIELINDIYAKNYAIEITNAFNDQTDVGTFVSIKIPNNPTS